MFVRAREPAKESLPILQQQAKMSRKELPDRRPPEEERKRPQDKRAPLAQANPNNPASRWGRILLGRGSGGARAREKIACRGTNLHILLEQAIPVRGTQTEATQTKKKRKRVPRQRT